MTVFFDAFVAVFSFIFSIGCQAGEADFRDQERLVKAAQARAAYRESVLSDFRYSKPDSRVSVEAYHFDLRILPNEGKIEGVVTLDLTSTAELKELFLNSSEIEINRVWLFNHLGVRSEALYELSKEGISIKMPTTLSSGVRFSVSVHYQVFGDRKDGRTLDYSRGLYFINTDGSQPNVNPTVYTSSEPILARSWYPCIDDPAYKAKRSYMRITVPEGWFAVSNGELKNIIHSPDRSGVTYEWQENFPIPTYLISIAAAPYQVVSERWNGIPIEHYVQENLKDKAKVDFANIPSMMEHFSNVWTPYGFEKYAMTAVPQFMGAMEHTTATTLSTGLITGDRKNELVFAHELAHHWWGNLVTLEKWDDLWLNEGFASYGEIIFTEKFLGKNRTFLELIKSRNKYFDFDPRGIRAVVDSELPPWEKFTPVTYEKGLWVLHMLRQQLGDPIFFGALKAYLEKYSYKNATTEDLRKEFEIATGKSLEIFFKQWVYGRGYPELQVSRWTFNPSSKNFNVTIHQKKTNFSFPIEILILGRNQKGEELSELITSEIKGGSNVLLSDLKGDFHEVVAILVDPQLKILKKVTAEKSPEELQYWLNVSSEEPGFQYFGLENISPESFTADFIEMIGQKLKSESREEMKMLFLKIISKSAKTHSVRDGHAMAFELLYNEYRLMKDSVDPYLIEAFGLLGDKRAEPILLSLFQKGTGRMSELALESLGRLSIPETFSLIVETLEKTEYPDRLRISAAFALAHFGGISAAKALSDQQKIEKDSDVKEAIRSALEILTGRAEYEVRLEDLSLKGSPVSLQWK